MRYAVARVQIVMVEAGEGLQPEGCSLPVAMVNACLAMPRRFEYGYLLSLPVLPSWVLGLEIVLKQVTYLERATRARRNHIFVQKCEDSVS